MATFVLCKRDFLQHETRRKMTRRRNELKRKRRGERCFRTKLSYFILAVHALSLHPSINPSVARSEKINSKKKNFYKRRIVEEEVKEKKRGRQKLSNESSVFYARYTLSHSSINLSTVKGPDEKKILENEFVRKILTRIIVIQ